MLIARGCHRHYGNKYNEIERKGKVYGIKKTTF